MTPLPSQLHLGDCLQIMRGLADASVDAVVTDPPYFRVKTDDWDRQWKTADDYLDWLESCLREFARVLRPNGSLYLFASPQMAARVQGRVAAHFHVLNEIVWVKAQGRHKQQSIERLRGYHPQTERIIFAEQHGVADNFALTEDGLRGDVYEPLRLWLQQEFDHAGWTAADIRHITGTFMGRHYTSRSQWALPTEAHYHKMQAAAPPRALRRSYECLRREYECLRREYECLRREYECLRREYECLRREYECLRRPFNLSGRAYMTDVWEFDTVSYKAGKHPCEKPLLLMEHILKTSLPPGGIVLDPFSGSGTTGAAAARLGFGFIGIEKEQDYLDIARARVAAVSAASL